MGYLNLAYQTEIPFNVAYNSLTSLPLWPLGAQMRKNSFIHKTCDTRGHIKIKEVFVMHRAQRSDFLVGQQFFLYFVPVFGSFSCDYPRLRTPIYIGGSSLKWSLIFRNIINQARPKRVGIPHLDHINSYPPKPFNIPSPLQWASNGRYRWPILAKVR